MDEMKWPDTATCVNGTTAYEDEHPDAEHRWQIIDDETVDVMAEFTATRATAENIARWMSGEVGYGAYWESFTARRRG